MQSHASKTSENKSQAPAYDNAPLSDVESVFQLARDGAKDDQQRMQNLASGSTQHKTMENLQQLASAGARAIQMKRLQEHTYPQVQRKETIQRKTDITIGPGFAIDNKINTGAPQGVFQLAIGTDDSLIGTYVVDRRGELFVLLQWSKSRQEWKVQRENPGNKQAITYRGADELNLQQESRGVSAMEAPEDEVDAPKVEKRKREPEKSSGSGSAAAPAAAAKSSKIVKKTPAPKPKGMLSFDPDELDDGDEVDTMTLKKGSQMELTDPNFRKKLEKQQKREAQRKLREMEETDESASAAALPQHSHSASSSAPAAQAIDFPTAHHIAANGEIRANMAKMLKHSTMTGQEYGGYIFWNPLTGAYYMHQAKPGASHEISLDTPPIAAPGFILVANFHTHPNAESHQAPSPQDVQLSSMRGIPSIVMDTAGKLYFSGPDSRSPGGDLGNYPIPDPPQGYMGPQQVKPGHGVRTID